MKETARSTKLSAALTKLAGKAIRKEPPRQMRAGVQAGYADIWWLILGTVRFVEVKQGYTTLKPHQELRAKEMKRLGFRDTLLVRFKGGMVSLSWIVAQAPVSSFAFVSYAQVAERIAAAFDRA